MTGAGATTTGGGATTTGAGATTTGKGNPRPKLKKKFVFAIDVAGTKRMENIIANKRSLFISQPS
jgi:hypothetical protein